MTQLAAGSPVHLTLVLVAAAILAATALGAALLRGRRRLSLWLGAAGAIAASALGVCAAVLALAAGGDAVLRWNWPLPLGSLHFGLDPLSAFFLLCLFAAALLSAVFSTGYLAGLDAGKPLAPVVAFFNLLVAAMAVVLVARDAVLFLVAWELMFAASFFLVTFEHERAEVREAGVFYLIASHAGVVPLFILFALLSRSGAGFDFDLLAASPLAGGAASLCFVLALLGFGAKAGLWPLHVWLPEAHPAAPSHVSALMSGVMIKMGIYGLLRTLGFLAGPQEWWAMVLLACGVVTALAGVLQALAQRDLKRVLAYSSVENVGIVAIGIGIGMLGRAHNDATVEALGYAGALVHVFNHAIMKGLLFHGAGAVLHATHTRVLDAMGGLQRRMPATGAAFLAGAVGISGLPPLAGFVGEWIIYLGAFRAAAVLGGGAAVLAIAAITTLALVGGLASACFVRAFGIAFLGSPRQAAAAAAHEAGAAMKAAMLAAAALCVAVGVWPQPLVTLAASALRLDAAALWSEAGSSLAFITRLSLCLLALTAMPALLRRRLLGARPVPRAATWGCGYAAPSPRMQYSASSFADLALRPFQGLVTRNESAAGVEGCFPAVARYEVARLDPAADRILLPALRTAVAALAQVRLIQQGRIQAYLLYMLVTLLALMAWLVLGGIA